MTNTLKYVEHLQENISLIDCLPASNSEIVKAEGQIGFTLPEAVRNFMLLVGGDYNLLLDDIGSSSLQFAHENQIQFADMLAENAVIFTENVFVFAILDEAFFVKPLNVDDPEVWCFSPELYERGDAIWPGYSSLGYQQGFYKKSNCFSEFCYNLTNNYLARKAKYI